MKLNEFNKLAGDGSEQDELLKLANRIKALRLEQGHFHYEKFALGNGIARAQYRSYELGGNVTYTSMLRIMKALNVKPAEFFREGFD